MPKPKAKGQYERSSLWHKVFKALENERDGLTFDRLALAAGITRQQLTSVMPLLQSSNAIVIDRQTKRWIRPDRRL